MSLSASIKSIQDIMRKDVGVDGDAQRVSQLVWLLFLKIFDAQEEELELTRDDYRSPLPQKLRWRNWAADAEGITGDELQKFVNDELFPGLKDLPPKSSRRALLRTAFEDAYNYMKSGTLLRQVINKLNEGINFNRSEDRHLFGDIYEQLLRDLQSAGNAGEYYTPRAVTQFMVERTNPRLGEIIFDPACGTGGFLTCALEHIRKREVKSPADEQHLEESIRGVEKKPLPHLLCATNMFLHGIEVEKKWWGKPGQESKRKENEFAWRVSIADIAARGYNLDVKNPHTVDDAHRDPAELLAEYQKTQAAVAEVREKLRRELETALIR